VPGDVAAA